MAETRARRPHRHAAALVFAALLFSLCSLPATASAATQLSTGEQLTNNQYLTSPNGRFRFLVDATGTVRVGYAGGSKRTLWSGGSVGIGGRVVMQGDGNLVGYDSAGVARWSSRTAGRGRGTAQLQDSGSLELRTSAGSYWSTNTRVYTLWAGDSLRSGWSIIAPGGTWKLGMQTDGNLVLRRIADGKVAWSSMDATGKRVAGSKTVIQSDGNFVVYSPTGDAIWASNTYAGRDASVVVSDAGSISVRRAGDIIWSSAGTYRNSFQVLDSPNWAGYAVRPDAGRRMAAATADITVPRVYCNDFDQQRFFTMWVGLDGFGSRTVEQAGINLSCPPGKVGLASPWAWWETYPEGANVFGGFVIKPGDHLTISVSHLGANRFRMRVVNHTSGKQVEATHTIAGAVAELVSAEWVIEYVGMPLAPYTSLSFFNASAQESGSSMTGLDSFANLTQLRMNSSYAKARPTGLWSPTAFSIR